jgi:predicted HNH restriction endonuclease
MPSIDEYVAALQSLLLSENDREMLRVHYESEEQTISPREMSEHFGWGGHNAANRHYGKLAGRMKAALGNVPSPSGDPNDVGVIARAYWPPGRELVWEMYPEFASALARLFFHTDPAISDDAARQRAYAAAKIGTGPIGTDIRNRYQRSEDVRQWALRRAAGKCEACLQPAPFVCPDGRLYLETHHTELVSEYGSDNPQVVGAICPTCHRRIHHGADGHDLNERLKTSILETERKLGPVGSVLRVD